MSYSATVFSVMIASPGDVGVERAIVREVIYEWNVVHANSRKIVLLPVGWETHSAPEMGEHPQDIINRQVLEQCDLLVGAFWTRIGTPTLAHPSGTVEEIEKHIAAGKPTMLYFSSQPVAPDSVEPEQYARLKGFKASCRDRGLYQPYDSPNDFKEKFNRQLQLRLNNHAMFTAVTLSDGFTSTSAVSQLPTLSHEAKLLIKSASHDPEGTVLRMKRPGGIMLIAERREFVNAYEPRETARWEAAMKQLLEEGLLEIGNKEGTVYKITALGYQVADVTVV